MEAKQFAELMKSPMQVAQLPTDALRELVNRYPFSASLQMLLLKHYQLNDHPAYDEQLAKAAIYAPDRRALYRLVQLREAPLKEVALKGIEPQVPETEPDEVLDEETLVEEPSILDTEPISYKQLEQQIADEEPLFTEEEITHIETDTPPFDEAPDENENEQESEQEVISDAGQVDVVSYTPPVIPSEHLHVVIDEQEPEEDEATEEISETVIEELAEAAATAIEVSDNSDIVLEEPITEEEAAVDEPTEPALEEVEPSMPEETTNSEATETTLAEPVEAETTPQPKPQKKPAPSTDSFMGWLQRVKRHELPKAMDAEDLQEKAALDALFGAGTYEATLVQESINLPEEEAPKAKVPPTREELMEPDDEANRRMDEQAKKSLTMGNELVTETLARIYEIQKKTGKAIEAYEILKLRFPEKVDQYNAKIKALREI